MKPWVPLLALACALIGGPGAGLAPAAGAEGYVIQLASVQSEERAREEWVRLQRLHPDLLGDMILSLQSAEVGDRGTFYRLRTGPFPNQATAEDMCWQLRAVQLECLVIQR